MTGPEPDAARGEAVRRWTRAVIHTSYVAKSRQDIELFLDECLGALLDAPGDTRAAAERIGARLVDVHFTNAAVLARTLQVLGAELPGFRTLPPGELLELLGAVAAGYAGALREQTLDQQEVIQQAVLHARDAAEEALRASEARSRAVFASSALGIAVAGLDGRIDEVNASMNRIFRSTGQDLVGQSIFALVDEAWLPELERLDVSLVAGVDDLFQLDTRFTTGDDSHIWTQLSASLVRDGDGAPSYQVLLYEDITERHMLQEQFRRQATHDPLTGLANRTLLKTRMDEALAASHPGRRVGLCYFDLDGFKAVNDSLGHPIGDDLLRSVAQRLNTLAAAEGAVAARMGGDEFVVLVPDSTGVTDLLDLVERMLGELTRPVRVGSHELSATASAGVVEREVAGSEPDQLLRDADITLYRAKTEGRAQWVLFDPEHNAAARERFKLSAALPGALETNELFVEYEPVVWLATGKMIAAEAVLRWDHEELGELGGEHFLELAEETGLISRLGGWALERVCEHAVRWNERVGAAAPVAALDLTARHCRAPELVGDVRRILDRTGMEPAALALGMPEAAMFDEFGDRVDTVEVFADMGLNVGIADFGRDHTRLARLRRLPVHAVKLAGSYLDSFAEPDGPDPLDEHLVRSFAESARLLGLPVVAAGVRTEEQAKRLELLGVQAVQGPCTGGPASAMEIEQALL
ncbi:EAL domain-containing protein [Saccharopolyspora sp. HNM0983]|uniref:EAL domain-containing protein n=1 Tax=Saccharopolyspora montiporae TaxID=2781240 RepID=A0A929B8G1_9PSEU|nr:EAL domain-containing protein [Saccharopolyspora sp. HNM0983]MBE9373361.1 EAL domain-containing protein [Saccharopolyspora sp. HNM0983]